ncbi:hypothetical protein MNBD_UNCLBAC01-1769 [hydrothermal vent metagenome]|uniref:Polymerase beta nucleotidyltransferase domain-containing protein n=1 Tax=hydrothermal vent metagenome TaxID=652676 RepID=A0A3B1DH12_9ZZZZ
MPNKKILQELRDYFNCRQDIPMAFVFGSWAKGKQMLESDFDLAVYFQPEGKMLEWESEHYYQEEDVVWNDVESMVKISTDLVVLNRAPSLLAFSVLQDGIPLVNKERSLYLDFLLRVSSTAEDFSLFTRDFWAIKQRSKSLTEIDRDRLMMILDFLMMELEDRAHFKGMTKDIYEDDRSKRRDFERWVENVMNATIDIAKIILASEKKKIPRTYKEVLEKLDSVKNFPAGTAQNLAQSVKLRNILAYEYLDRRFDRLKKFIEDSEKIYDEFIEFVKKFLKF